MRATIKSKLYEFVDNRGAVTYRVLSPREAKGLMSKKNYKNGFIVAKCLGVVTIRIEISNLKIS